jgi:hypothetical protein
MLNSIYLYKVYIVYPLEKQQQTKVIANLITNYQNYSCHQKINTYKTYVKPPRPIVVKKLIANLVSLGLSRGKRPA